MLDVKVIKQALEQLEEERRIPKERSSTRLSNHCSSVQKEYGKRGQIVRAKFDLETGITEFFQIKKVVDDTMVYMAAEDEEETAERPEGDERVRFNEEHHIMLEDAQKIKKILISTKKLFSHSNQRRFRPHCCTNSKASHHSTHS